MHQKPQMPCRREQFGFLTIIKCGYGMQIALLSCHSRSSSCRALFAWAVFEKGFFGHE
jgi:hypothetical protein